MNNRINIKDVSIIDVLEYQKHLSGDGTACPWSHEQAQLIADCLMADPMFKKMVGQLIDLSPILGAAGVITTTYVSGFQSGREFENRMMAKAIREGK